MSINSGKFAYNSGSTWHRINHLSLNVFYLIVMVKKAMNVIQLHYEKWNCPELILDYSTQHLHHQAPITFPLEPCLGLRPHHLAGMEKKSLREIKTPT